MVKAISALILLLLKHLKVNHIYQVRSAVKILILKHLPFFSDMYIYVIPFNWLDAFEYRKFSSVVSKS